MIVGVKTYTKIKTFDSNRCITIFARYMISAFMAGIRVKIHFKTYDFEGCMIKIIPNICIEMISVLTI